MTRIASCQCRGFRVVVEAEPDTVAICHCQICQRRTGVPLTCNAYFPKSKVRLEGEHRIYTRDCPEDANCTTTSARPAARRSAGLSIYVQISLALRLGASMTGIFRCRWRRSLPCCQVFPRRTPPTHRCKLRNRAVRFSSGYVLGDLGPTRTLRKT